QRRAEARDFPGSPRPPSGAWRIHVPPLTAPTARALSRELFLQELVDQRRVRLALGCLHHLADEETEQLVLSGAIFADFVGLRLHHGLDCGLDGAGVGHLLETALLDER